MARILVIDDSKIARLMMRRQLEQAGHEVVEAAGGAEGLEVLTASSFDLVTCDVLMPEMTGIEFLAAVREHEIETPVIVATADIQRTTREECAELGAWAVVSKPVDAAELHDLIARLPTDRAPQVLVSAKQMDGLTELINVGVGRAAASLNDLVDGHVELAVPYIDLVDKEHLEEALEELGRDPLSSVQMGFHGGLSGNAFLVFPEPSALQLVEILVGAESGGQDFDSIHAATLNEIGNIVISAVMGTMGNVLSRSLQYSLPVFEQEPILDIVALHSNANPIVLIARTSFVIRQSVAIQGHLLLLFELTSMDALIESINDWEMQSE